jgi:hypothetical protein
MSGLEVAGVVLGAIPLVIAGLDYYGQGVSSNPACFDVVCQADWEDADCSDEEHEELCHCV